MNQLENENDFALNEKGQLSRMQVRHLVFWLLRYNVIIAIGGLGVGLAIRSYVGLIIGSVTIGIIVYLIGQYTLDLTEGHLLSAIGEARKERTGYRGPAYYMVIVSDELRIRALKKSQWQRIEAGSTYQLFFTRRTKWLLSYKRLTSPPG